MQGRSTAAPHTIYRPTWKDTENHSVNHNVRVDSEPHKQRLLPGMYSTFLVIKKKPGGGGVKSWFYFFLHNTPAVFSHFVKTELI